MARWIMTTPPYDQVNAARMMADVEALARWVRLSGTSHEMEAVRYAQKRLRAAGCQTRVILHDAFISLPGTASLQVLTGGSAAAVPCITHSFAAPTGPGGLERAAVYAAVPADLAGVAAGRIAVVDGLASPAVVRAVEMVGAAGLVCLNRDPYVHEMIVSPVWGSPTLEDLAALPKIPVVSVAGRDAGPVREAARTGARLRLFAEVDTRWRKTPILIGELPGAVEETFVLFSGHLDSWHRGAMDNGGANATMLELARVMGSVRRYRGVRFAFWSGHSHGRYSGSTWYADHYWHELDARCVLHLNVDSTGGRGSVLNRHAYAMPETRGVADAVIRELAGGRFVGQRVGRMGDQSFLGVGLPSLLMDISEQEGTSPEASVDFSAFSGGGTGGLGWWWHTTEDTPDKIDPALLERDARVYLGILHAFVTSPVLPLDYGAAAHEWLKRLREVRAASTWADVKGALAEARRLAHAAELLHRHAQAVAASGDRSSIRATNAALMAMGRALIPIDFTRAGRFGHDPALPQSDPPHLAALRALAHASGDEARHLAVQAVRDLNAIRHALATAAQAAEAVVSAPRPSR
ncbi:MAG: M28 family peptidase [Armatimonadota bacterium]|nr:M28 family peptidase [Armatimonadota bacterium]